jgi:uncharacterized membrane protein YuzA (DUF378 family)
MMNKDAIEAVVTKDKVNKKVVYAFSVNNESFEAHYSGGKKPVLELRHNGSFLGDIDTSNVHIDYTVNSETYPIKITAWIDTGSALASFTGRMSSIGIEVNGKPVQYTTADPETHIRNGKTSLYILLFILGLKSIITYYSSFKEYGSHIVAGISISIYIIPFVIILFAVIMYAKWTAFAIFTSGIIGILELVDYIFGAIDSIKSSSSPVSLIIWILIRFSALYLLFNAYNWKRKQRKQQASIFDVS